MPRLITRPCGRCGEPFVRGDVLHQAEQLGREGLLLHRHGACISDPRWNFDDVIVGKPREDASIADIDYLNVVGVGRERCDERIAASL